MRRITPGLQVYGGASKQQAFGLKAATYSSRKQTLRRGQSPLPSSSPPSKAEMHNAGLLSLASLPYLYKTLLPTGRIVNRILGWCPWECCLHFSVLLPGKRLITVIYIDLPSHPFLVLPITIGLKGELKTSSFLLAWVKGKDRVPESTNQGSLNIC